MIPFGAETVTLYNRREAKDANGRTLVSWRRHVLGGCTWTQTRERKLIDNAVHYTDIVACRIPASAEYLPPDEWDAIGGPVGLFTLAPGDVLVRGAVGDEIGVGMSAGALLKKYARRGAITVQSAKDNARAGTPLPHYLAKGV